MITLEYSDYGTTSPADAIAVVIGGLFAFLFSIVGYVISSFLLMKVFERAGVQGKWRAWVPVYNSLIAAKLGDFSPWVLLGLAVAASIPFVNILGAPALIVALVLVYFRINAKFGRSWPFLLLLLLVPIGQWILLGIYAFSGKPYNPAIGPAPWANSFLADKTVWDGVPVQPGQQVAPTAGSTGAGYGTPPAPPAQGYAPPSTPPASGSTPPPPAPPTYPGA